MNHRRRYDPWPYIIVFGLLCVVLLLTTQPTVWWEWR